MVCPPRERGASLRKARAPSCTHRPSCKASLGVSVPPPSGYLSKPEFQATAGHHCPEGRQKSLVAAPTRFLGAAIVWGGTTAPQLSDVGKQTFGTAGSGPGYEAPPAGTLAPPATVREAARRGSHLKKRRRERICPRSTRKTPRICSRAQALCGSSQRGVCRRPVPSGKRRWASALEGELVGQVV